MTRYYQVDPMSQELRNRRIREALASDDRFNKQIMQYNYDFITNLKQGPPMSSIDRKIYFELDGYITRLTASLNKLISSFTTDLSAGPQDVSLNVEANEAIAFYNRACHVVKYFIKIGHLGAVENQKIDQAFEPLLPLLDSLQTIAATVHPKRLFPHARAFMDMYENVRTKNYIPVGGGYSKVALTTDLINPTAMTAPTSGADFAQPPSMEPQEPQEPQEELETMPEEEGEEEEEQQQEAPSQDLQQQVDDAQEQIDEMVDSKEIAQSIVDDIVDAVDQANTVEEVEQVKEEVKRTFTDKPTKKSVLEDLKKQKKPYRTQDIQEELSIQLKQWEAQQKTLDAAAKKREAEIQQEAAAAAEEPQHKASNIKGRGYYNVGASLLPSNMKTYSKNNKFHDERFIRLMQGNGSYNTLRQMNRGRLLEEPEDLEEEDDKREEAFKRAAELEQSAEMPDATAIETLFKRREKELQGMAKLNKMKSKIDKLLMM